MKRLHVKSVGHRFITSKNKAFHIILLENMHSNFKFRPESNFYTQNKGDNKYASVAIEKKNW